MSATGRLRKLLDERGVEWEPSAFDPKHETFYSVENGVGIIVTEFPEIGRVSLACDMRITPEQAIAATLGAGTCRNIDGDYDSYFECSECGCHVVCNFYGSGYDEPRFCPFCGRKVEQ